MAYCAQQLVCKICGENLSSPSIKRRIIHPSTPGNHNAREFLINSVVQVPAEAEKIFDRDRPSYSCRNCFSKLERGFKHMKEEKTIIEEIRGSMVHELTESGQQHSDPELYEKQSRTVSPSADQDLESTQLNPSIEPSTGVQTTDEEMLFEEEGALQTQPRSLGSRKRDSGALQPNDDSAQVNNMHNYDSNQSS